MEYTEAHLSIDTPELAGRRVDLVIAESTIPLSRSRIKSRNAEILCNGKPVKPSYLVRQGDHLLVRFLPEPATQLRAQAVEFGVVYEDEDVLVVNKPQGLVVHPGAGNYENTLAHGLLFHHLEDAEPGPSTYADDAQDSLENQRAGIVHRLDKDTSGVLITAKNARSLEFLQREFAERRTEKLYLALTMGIPQEKKGRIQARIVRHPRRRTVFTTDPRKGRESLTTYRVVHEYHIPATPYAKLPVAGPVQKGGRQAGPRPGPEQHRYALLAVQPVTGRTHQLRVHLSSIACPILGDPLYAPQDKLFPEHPLMLHAYSLGIRLPSGGGMRLFRAPVPDGFFELLRRMREMDTPQD